MDIGPVIKARHAQDAPLVSFEEWIGRNEATNPVFVPDIIGQYIDESKDERSICITGARSTPAIQGISNTISPESSSIVYIDASPNIRRTRYEQRTGYDRTMDFQSAENYNTMLGTPQLCSIADEVIVSEGSLDIAAQRLVTVSLTARTIPREHITE